MQNTVLGVPRGHIKGQRPWLSGPLDLFNHLKSGSAAPVKMTDGLMTNDKPCFLVQTTPDNDCSVLTYPSSLALRSQLLAYIAILLSRTTPARLPLCHLQYNQTGLSDRDVLDIMLSTSHSASPASTNRSVSIIL